MFAQSSKLRLSQRSGSNPWHWFAALVVCGPCAILPAHAQRIDLPTSWNLQPLSERYQVGLTRLMIVGDSISKMADQRLPSGIVRTWSPPQGWKGGLVDSRNNGNFGFDGVASRPAATTRQAFEFDDGVASIVAADPLGPGTIMEWRWDSDPDNTGGLNRYQFDLNLWAGPDGVSWALRDDFKGWVIYTEHSGGVARGLQIRPYDGRSPNGSPEIYGDDALNQEITWYEHDGGQASAYTITSIVEMRVRYENANPDIGDGHVIHGCRIFLDDPTGFELATISAGGSSPADWADSELYTNEQLGRLFEACETNVIFVYLGANRGGDKATYKNNMTAVAQRIEAAFATFAPSEQPIVVMVAVHDMGGNRDTHGWSEACFEIAREQSEAQNNVIYSYLNLHDLIIGNLGTWEEIRDTHMNDVVHPNQRGADEFMALAEQEILRGPREIVQPVSFTVPIAQDYSGGLGDLLDSDDSRLVAQAIWQACPACPGIVVEIHGTASITNVSALTMFVESQVSLPFVDQEVELYDFDSQAWQVLDRAIASVNSDRTISIVVEANASAFIDNANGEIRARLSYVPTQPLLSPVWFGRIDQVQWEVTAQN